MKILKYFLLIFLFIAIPAHGGDYRFPAYTTSRAEMPLGKVIMLQIMMQVLSHLAVDALVMGKQGIYLLLPERLKEALARRQTLSEQIGDASVQCKDSLMAITTKEESNSRLKEEFNDALGAQLGDTEEYKTLIKLQEKIKSYSSGSTGYRDTETQIAKIQEELRRKKLLIQENNPLVQRKQRLVEEADLALDRLRAIHNANVEKRYALERLQSGAIKPSEDPNHLLTAKKS